MSHSPLTPHTQATLAKSFADTEPGMRPRVWTPQEVHKPHNNLTTADVEVRDVPRAEQRGGVRGETLGDTPS